MTGEERIARFDRMIDLAKKKKTQEVEERIIKDDEDYYLAIGYMNKLALSYRSNGQMCTFKENKINITLNAQNDRVVKKRLKDLCKASCRRIVEDSFYGLIIQELLEYVPDMQMRDRKGDAQLLTLHGLWYPLGGYQETKETKESIKGLYWDKHQEKWKVQISIDGKSYFLGRYKNKEDAISIRKKAEEKISENGNFLEWYKTIKEKHGKENSENSESDL